MSVLGYPRLYVSIGMVEGGLRSRAMQIGLKKDKCGLHTLSLSSVAARAGPEASMGKKPSKLASSTGDRGRVRLIF